MAHPIGMGSAIPMPAQEHDNQQRGRFRAGYDRMTSFFSEGYIGLKMLVKSSTGFTKRVIAA
jgi:hypothetical protein